ncbi:hypothetical protein SLEP1_g32036 [Rubroshorea leprosula]|uniref:Uncharacterized protein n=1 Tax=Rubroshorea leprosula TaxID=152421 RepID=A0AAV5KCA5_9ROSI|nr:hypothetical protein SLEP1_g32036 [Rubroshorea leprosula]
MLTLASMRVSLKWSESSWNDIETGFDHFVIHQKFPLLMPDILITFLLRNRDDYIDHHLVLSVARGSNCF